MIWQSATDAGLRTVVINVPFTFPAEPVNGLMISGMDAPTLEGAVWPEEAMAALLCHTPGYSIDVMPHWYPDRSEFFSCAMAAQERHHEFALSRFETMEPDLFICVYVIADRMQHVGWTFPPDLTIVAAYEALDQALGDYLEMLEPGDRLMVVSDHGFQNLEGEVCLNRIFEDLGLLVLDRKRGERILDRFNKNWIHSKGPYRQPFESVWELPPRALWFDAVQWRRTKCAAYGLVGNLMVNLRGRDPRGIVNSGSEVKSLLEEISRGVQSRLRDSQCETQVVVHPVDGSKREDARTAIPDAVIEIDEFKISTWGGREFFSPSTIYPNPDGFLGTHRREGVFIGLGPGFSAGWSDRPSEMVDIAPTISECLGLARDECWPGVSLIGG